MQILILLITLSNFTLCQSNPDTSKPFLTFIIGKNFQKDKTKITTEQIERLDYKTPADILVLKYKTFANELGENGKPVNLNLNLTNMRSTQFLLNGRTLNAYIYPYPSLNILPMDNIIAIEVDKTFSSALFQNANSSIVNFIFKNTFTSRPITRIRYVEDAYDLTVADGSFSYNIFKSLNFTLGFRRSTSAGRFENSQYDAWNLFLNSLWSPTEKLKISMLNIYTTENNALNGGVDITKLSPEDENMLYNERIAPVVEPNSNLSSKRNDLTIILNYKLDSINEANLTLYHTFQKNRYSSSKDPNERSSNFYGFKFNLFKTIQSADLNIGFEVQKNNLNLSLLSDSLSTGYLKPGSNSLLSLLSFLKIEINLGRFTPSAFLRLESLHKKIKTNYGFGLSTDLNQAEIYAGFSTSFRTPTLLEQLITNSSDFEKHTIYESGLKYKIKNVQIEIKIQNRKISNYLIFHDSSFYRTYVSRTFAEANSTFKFWNLTFEVSPCIMLNKITKPYPGYFLRSELFFEGKLTKTLNLKAGARANFSDKFYGFRFINSAGLFVEDEVELKKFTTIDLFLSGKIKNAIIILTLANATNTKYMTTTFYPMQNRSLRLGVVWTFFD